jgi:hypothetical protein
MNLPASFRPAGSRPPGAPGGPRHPIRTLLLIVAAVAVMTNAIVGATDQLGRVAWLQVALTGALLAGSWMLWRRADKHGRAAVLCACALTLTIAGTPARGGRSVGETVTSAARDTVGAVTGADALGAQRASAAELDRLCKLPARRQTRQVARLCAAAGK